MAKQHTKFERTNEKAFLVLWTPNCTCSRGIWRCNNEHCFICHSTTTNRTKLSMERKKRILIKFNWPIKNWPSYQLLNEIVTFHLQFIYLKNIFILFVLIKWYFHNEKHKNNNDQTIRGATRQKAKNFKEKNTWKFYNNVAVAVVRLKFNYVALTHVLVHNFISFYFILFLLPRNRWKW